MSIEADDRELVLEAQAGDPAAFDRLCVAHDRATFGFVRARSRTDEDAREILQETRIAIWEHIRQYRPERAPFRAFATFWAGICLMRYYRSCKRRRQVESLFSELAERFPDLEQEQDLADILTWMRQESSPEDEPEPVPTATYERLLRSVMDAQNPPHQVLAFCLCHLVRVTPSDGGAGEPVAKHLAGRGRTEPRVVARELSDVPLGVLAARLEEQYLHQSSLPDQVVRECFRPLHDRMSHQVGDAITDHRSRETYAHLLERSVAGTTLGDYYTSGPEADIPHWWYAVKRRVLADAGRSSNPDTQEAGVPPAGLAARIPVVQRRHGGRKS